jgi:hypothetical protein
MPFLVYRRSEKDGLEVLESMGNNFQLAGSGLLYKAWQEFGEPANKGWHATANDLIRINSEGKESYSTVRLLIDFEPVAPKRISLGELLDVYAFTFVHSEATVEWTPVMLRGRTVFYEEGAYDSPQERDQRKRVLVDPPYEKEEFVEFLYLQGNWNWGRNGQTNAAFIFGEARTYFRQFF